MKLLSLSQFYALKNTKYQLKGPVFVFSLPGWGAVRPLAPPVSCATGYWALLGIGSNRSI